MFNLQSNSTCLKVSNFLRIPQFLVKVVLVWIIYIDCCKYQLNSWQKAQMGLSIPFFAWYEFWRLYYLFKKVNAYHIQYYFTIFDVTAMAIIKTFYIDLKNISLANKDLSDLYRDISYVYAAYLIFPVIIYAVWLILYCRVNSAAQKINMPIAEAILSNVSITFLAKDKLWYRIFVYINIFIGLVIALAVTWANINFFIDFGTKGHMIFFLSFLFELLDLLFNLIQDRVVCVEMKKNPAALIIRELQIPGLELWYCPCCTPEPNFAFDEANSSLIP